MNVVTVEVASREKSNKRFLSALKANQQGVFSPPRLPVRSAFCLPAQEMC